MYYLGYKGYMVIMVSHNGNIRHCARSVFRPVGIAPSRGRHSALTVQFSLVGIRPVGIRACTRPRDNTIAFTFLPRTTDTRPYTYPFRSTILYNRATAPSATASSMHIYSKQIIYQTTTSLSRKTKWRRLTRLRRKFA